MRRIRRISAFSFAILMLGMVFASCGGEGELSVGSEAPENGEDARKSVVIGLLFLPPATEEAIERYNLVSEEKIVLRRYEDSEKLNLAVLSGEIDMVATPDAGVLEKYASRSLLEPLDAILNGATTDGTLFPNVVKAGSVGGACYMIPDTVSVKGMMLPSTVLDGKGDRFEDMRDLIGTLDGLTEQDFYMVHTKEIALDNFLRHGISAWVDREKGVCRFEDEEFLLLLSLCNRYAPDQDTVTANAPQNRKVLFDPCYTMDAYGRDVSGYEYEVNGSGKPYSEYGLAGRIFPAPYQKDAGYALDPGTLYAVLKGSRAKSSAAAFLSWFLSPETQIAMCERFWIGIPVNTEAYREMVEKGTRETLEMKDLIVTEEEITEESLKRRAERSLAVFRAADHYGGAMETDIQNVIREEAARYFAGEITAEKAAEYIQNRVSIYLAEQG